MRKAINGLNEEKYLKNSIEYFDNENEKLKEEIKTIENEIK